MKALSAPLRRLLCLAAALWIAAPGPGAAASPGIGATAPQFELVDLAGTPRTLVWGGGAGAATIVFFFSPQSPDCLLEMSFLDALYRLGRDFGLAVYAVECEGRQPAEVGRALERYCSVYRDPAFPVLPDPSFRTGRTYGIERSPVTFVTESHGVILNRIEGYDHAAAVAIARRTEQLLRRERGFFSPVLREAGISEAEERDAEARLAAAAQAVAPAARSLAAGDRAPAFEFTDVGGRAGRWSWPADGGKGVRVLAFFAGLSLESVEELRWLDGLARRGRDAGLEVLAVETGGLDRAGLADALERYRRFNPDLSFPVVPDPDKTLTRAFGSWDRLPQTFLLSGDGTVIHRAEGFDAGEGEILTGKAERAVLLQGRTFPAAGAGAATLPPVEEEAPSVRKRQEQDSRYRTSIVQADAAFLAWEFDRALSNYQAALEVQPQDLHALVRIAQIHERRGEIARALEFWDRVLAVRPDHEEAAARVRALRTR